MTQQIWQRRMEWPLTIVSIVFLFAYAVEVLADLPENKAPVLEVIMWAVWLIFAVDYVVNLVLAPRKLAWFVWNLHLLLIVLLPILRPLRLLRLVSFVTLIQRRAGTALRGQVAAYVIVSAALLVLVGSLAILDAEQNIDGSNIKNFGEAVWWACATILTVGYGDYFPVTAIGRTVAVGLMISGVAVLGVVTATIASWLVERVAVENQAAEKPEFEELMSELKSLRAEIAALRDSAANGPRENSTA
ncbi:potassium channel family protein [Renibacterium salmoninarum]|uniref:potassium channel family protein n=1 Tax=Renibacterium salmoninarum TaxID=1646 RepID=UPI0002F13AA3|nr:potassium channel family protein [Renibacterium salmoninarum]